MDFKENTSPNIGKSLQLPMLGLGKYVGMVLDKVVDDRNPFKIIKNSEALLLARERERIKFSKEEKLLKSNLPVYKKFTFTKFDREGVIRDINRIRPTKTRNTSKLNKTSDHVASLLGGYDEEEKVRINILKQDNVD
jgi:hypothetical protein